MAYTKRLSKGADLIRRLQPSVEFPHEEKDTLDVELVFSKKHVLKKRVEVQATSEEDALNKVKEAYNKCDIILDENDFTDVKFKIKKVIDSDSDEEES